jgi:hypothetical protein
MEEWKKKTKKKKDEYEEKANNLKLGLESLPFDLEVAWYASWQAGNWDFPCMEIQLTRDTRPRSV